ncbi:alpha/beta hydrolase family protein [Ensifer sp. SL37]|uniref:alpha/beta hydrolase family protein n=1 Tax=Ensifer sp. SL37 TaxID=2995137 RepID=UPI002273CAFB|nr:prolyl oligopeptidase family serine peptidase [Ensifer sp. SL37]MCY1740493.1 prolyl oligopeptidase family serine peptidase [Ensifer sp. SL37]
MAASFVRTRLARALRFMKWYGLRGLFVMFGVPCSSGGVLADQPTLGPFERTNPRELVMAYGAENFSATEALNGSFSSREHCADTNNCLWLEVGGRGDCIRYYQHGLKETGNRSVLVYFGGDVLMRTSKGVRYIASSYSSSSPAKLTSDMVEWSSQANIPAVYIARPGIYGSSGDHNKRRDYREISLMSRALDSIKERYRITSFILTGHSAGGQIVAALLNERSDISAAVISSGLVSVKQVSSFWEHKRQIPGKILYNAKSFYDPVEGVDQIRKDHPPEIYVISDPEDRVVPFYSQLYYVRRLRRSGLHPEHIYAQAPLPSRHVLAPNAKLAAALLAQGKTAIEIRKALLEFELRTAHE